MPGVTEDQSMVRHQRKPSAIITQEKSRNRSVFMKLTQTNKGEFGYLKRERKRRIIIAAIMLGVPVFIFISMWIYLGTRNSIWTIIALVGSLPGCKAVVDVIMVYLAKPVDPVLYKKIHAHQGDLVMAYEMYMTFYEKKCTRYPFGRWLNI